MGNCGFAPVSSGVATGRRIGLERLPAARDGSLKGLATNAFLREATVDSVN